MSLLLIHTGRPKKNWAGLTIVILNPKQPTMGALEREGPEEPQGPPFTPLLWYHSPLERGNPEETNPPQIWRRMMKMIMIVSTNQKQAQLYLYWGVSRPL